MNNELSTACQRLKDHDETLTLLNLSCQGIGSEGVIKLSKSCANASIKTKEQKEGDHNNIINNNQHDDMTSTSASASASLVALWLDGNDIYVSGAKALLGILQQSPKLKYLYMSNNFIGNGGISALAPISFQQCHVCNFGDNQIDHVGAGTIAESLENLNCCVHTLKIDNNLLNDKGALSIANSLRDNISLKTLDLRFNLIGKDGLSAFRDILKNDNTSLQYLLLDEEDDVPSIFYTDDNINRQRYHIHQSFCTTTRRETKRRRSITKHNKMESSLKKLCRSSCEICWLKYEIEYYLALNRAGRQYWKKDLSINTNLWPLILSKVSPYHDDNDPASLLYTMLKTRPDIIKSSQQR